MFTCGRNILKIDNANDQLSGKVLLLGNLLLCFVNIYGVGENNNVVVWG